MTSKGLERVQGGAELALAAVDQEDVGERLVALLEPLDAPADHLSDRGEVVDPATLLIL